MALSAVCDNLFGNHKAGFIGHDRNHALAVQPAHRLKQIALKSSRIASERCPHDLFASPVMQKLPDRQKSFHPLLPVESALAQVSLAGAGYRVYGPEPAQQPIRKLVRFRRQRSQQSGQVVMMRSARR